MEKEFGFLKKIKAELHRGLVYSVNGIQIMTVKEFGGQLENTKYTLNRDAIASIDGLALSEKITPNDYYHVVGIVHDGTSYAKGDRDPKKYFLLYFD